MGTKRIEKQRNDIFSKSLPTPKTGSHYVVQAGLELRNLSTRAVYPCLGLIKDKNHHTQPFSHIVTFNQSFLQNLITPQSGGLTFGRQEAGIFSSQPEINSGPLSLKKQNTHKTKANK